ncbi:hypothetical protein VUR80DRAFT_8581 [Thermomyces stellatus]
MVSILLPLYIYPQDGSWEPLLAAAAAYSAVDFTVIVNPDSGPGVASLPDENYIDALRSLGSYSNVNLLGYIRCGYGDREIDEIDADIATYAGWESEFASLGDGGATVELQGVFVDEVPAEMEYVDLMSHITESVRDAWENGMYREATVVYNPGVVIDRMFYEHADSVVAFEDAEAERAVFMSDGLADVDWYNRGKTGAIVHTYSGTWNDLQELVREVADSGLESLFVTDQAGGIYNKWPSMWTSLVQLVSDRAQAETR